MLPLLRFSPIFGLVALLAPATAALIAAGITGGRPGARRLIQKLAVRGVQPW